MMMMMTVLCSAAGFPRSHQCCSCLDTPNRCQALELVAEYIVDVNPPFAGALQ
jgi:hypothetical protein